MNFLTSLALQSTETMTNEFWLEIRRGCTVHLAADERDSSLCRQPLVSATAPFWAERYITIQSCKQMTTARQSSMYQSNVTSLSLSLSPLSLSLSFSSLLLLPAGLWHFSHVMPRGDTPGEGWWWHVYTAERCSCILTVSRITYLPGWFPAALVFVFLSVLLW